ncbi:MAG: hypothetical protein RML12_02165 [Xanthomonadales bacterium]|nr:hypothetical protein [Xanthomonadales bacterium]
MILRFPPRHLLLAAAMLVPPCLAAQSLDESVRRIERETGGRILSAETLRAGDREIHRIKVLTPDGRLRVIQREVPLAREGYGFGRDFRESRFPEVPAPRRERPRLEREERAGEEPPRPDWPEREERGERDEGEDW